MEMLPARGSHSFGAIGRAPKHLPAPSRPLAAIQYSGRCQPPVTQGDNLSNPFNADYYVYDKWFYLLLIKIGAPNERHWRNETRLHVHNPRGKVNWEETDTHIHIFDDNIDDWQNVSHCVHHLWELNDFAAANSSSAGWTKRQAMKRHFTVKDKTVRVVVRTNWINNYQCEVSISLLHSVAPLVEYKGNCADLQCAIYLFTAWAWFSKEPGYGVIDATRGRVSRGSKFIYTAQLAHLHKALSTREYELRVCQHEDHGFYVA
ncbi:hypothetical protein GOP47_0012378 [Adiantum capillus-veneris]|uniref:Uncharacterized protein n=1 Tax=Adiantum capillus-veneris TaxID=13818 RepID=A0A9D4UR26_ADICA|nr:hypothetical protein GOP47_0012378 [Adiantum capillus-veneris]